MDELGLSREKVLELLERAYDQDHHFDEGRVLASMCTKPHELAIEAHIKFIETNLGNPGLYPGTKALEKEVISILGKLLHCPGVPGHMTSGGTESNITALWVAKKEVGKSEILFPKNIHFSIKKAIDLLNLKPIEIDLDENYCMSIDDLEVKLSDNTAAVVCLAGATELGGIDPVEKISQLCSEKVFLHVDAAYGGFIIPFLKELGYDIPKFDFELAGVSTISIDPHKMGFSTIPAGVLLYRSEEYLEQITVDAPYLLSMKYSTLSGTRNSAAVAATYAVLRHLGRIGFRKVVSECMKNTQYCASKVRELGLELVIEPVTPVIGIRLKNPETVMRELAKQNWFVSQGKFPPCLRIVVMPHVTRAVIDEFMPAFENTCSALGEL